MDSVTKYLLLPLQQKVFKNFGYYEYRTNTFKVNVHHVNDLLAGNTDPFGRRVPVAQQRKGVEVGAHEASLVGRGVFRIVKAEVKSASLLDYVRLFAKNVLQSEEDRIITIDTIEMIVEFVPHGPGGGGGREGAPPLPPVYSDGGATGPSAHEAGCGCDHGTQTTLPTDSADGNLFRSFNVREGMMPRSETPVGSGEEDGGQLDTVGELMRFIRRKLQGAGMAVEQVYLTLLMPPSAPANDPTVSSAPGQTVQMADGTVIFHLRWQGGLLAMVDKTDPNSEDVEASVQMGDCRLFMHTVSSADTHEDRQYYATAGKLDLGLEDLFVASQPAQEQTSHTSRPHCVSLSYTSGGPAKPTSLLFTAVRVADWAVVCRPEQVAQLVQVAAAVMEPVGQLPIPSQAPPPRSCDPPVAIDNDAPVNAAETVRAAMVAAGHIHLARKLFHIHCPTASLTLLTQRGVPKTVVAAAWSRALRDVSAANNKPVYEELAASHFTAVVAGADVLFPEVEERVAFGAMRGDPRRDAATKKKRSIIRNLFRHGIADAKLTEVMQTHGGRSCFSAVQSVHLFEYRPRPGRTRSCMPTPILQVQRLPYALVNLTRRSAAVPRAATRDPSYRPAVEVHEECVFVALGRVLLRIDPELFDVAVTYATTLLELLGESTAALSPSEKACRSDYSPRVGALRSAIAPKLSGMSSTSGPVAPPVHRLVKVLLEHAEAVGRFPVFESTDTHVQSDCFPAGTPDEPSLLESVCRHPLLQRLLRHLSAKSRSQFKTEVMRAADEGHDATLRDYLAFPADTAARFLPVVMSVHFTDFQAKRCANGETTVRWKEAVGALVDEVDQHTTELVRIDFSDDMNITVSYKDLAEEGRASLGTQLPDGELGAASLSGVPPALQDVFAVMIRLGEVITQPLTQDDYILTMYYVRILLATAQACRQRITKQQRSCHSYRPTEVRMGGASLHKTVEQSTSASLLCDLMEANDVLAEALQTKRTLNTGAADADKSTTFTETCSSSPSDLRRTWWSPNASATYVEFQLRRVHLHVRTPRLSPQGTPLGEPLLRCLPREVHRSVDQRLLFHNYLLDVSGLCVAFLSCDAAKVGSVADLVTRVSRFSLAEDVPPWPTCPEQFHLVHKVCIARSYIADSLSMPMRATPPSGREAGGLRRQEEAVREGYAFYPFIRTEEEDDVIHLHLTSRVVFNAIADDAKADSDVTNEQRIAVDIMLHRVGFHHLPAHLGDTWPAALVNYFTDRPTPSDKSTPGSGKSPSDFLADAASSSRGAQEGFGETGATTATPRFVALTTQLRLYVTDVMWVYRPQGAGRSIITVLAPDMVLSGEIPSALLSPKVTIRGGAIRPASLYLCNDCDVDALAENILNKTGAGWGADMESAGFVRVMDVCSSLLPCRRGAPKACRREFPAAAATDLFSAGGAAVPCNVTVIINRSAHADRPIQVRVHHIQVNAFAAKDSLRALREAVDSFSQHEGLQCVEAPYKCVMRCGRWFQWVEEAVLRESAPMTYRLHPLLSQPTQETMSPPTTHSSTLTAAVGAPLSVGSSLFSGTFREGMRWSEQNEIRKRAAYMGRVSYLRQRAWRSHFPSYRRSNSGRGGQNLSTTVVPTDLPKAARQRCSSTSSFESLGIDPGGGQVVWTVLRPSPRTNRTAAIGRMTKNCEVGATERPCQSVFHLPTVFEHEAHYLSGLHRPVPTSQPLDIHCLPLQMDNGEPPRVLPPTEMELYLTDCGLHVSLYDGHDLTDAALRQQRRGYNQITGVGFYGGVAPVSLSAGSVPGCYSSAFIEGDLQAEIGGPEAEGDSETILSRLHAEGIRRGFGDRNFEKRLVLMLCGIKLQMNTFAAGAEEQKWLHLVIASGTVYDSICTSDVRKLLTTSPSHPGDWTRTLNFFELTWLTLFPGHASSVPDCWGGDRVGLRGNPEECVAVRLQPVSLTLSGASLDFLLRLFMAPHAPSDVHPNGACSCAGMATRSVMGDAGAPMSPPPLFFRSFTLYPTVISLSGSFESDKGLLSAISGGSGIEVLRNTPLLSWLSVRNLPLVIPFIRMERCGLELLQERLVEDSRCKSIRFLLTACCCVVHPLSAATRVGDAAVRLVLVPFSYGRAPVLQHTIAKASSIFLSEVVTQSAYVGSMVSNSTYRASRVLLEAVMGHPMHAIDGPSRARQPAGLAEGLRDGQVQLQNSLRDAFDYCLGPDGNLIKVPAAVLRVLVGLSGFTTSALWGIRNGAGTDDTRQREATIYK